MSTSAVPALPRHSGALAALRARPEQAQQLGLAAFFMLEIFFFTLITPDFLSGSNLFSVGRAVTILAIVAVGATFGLISGALDLSVASVIALAGTVATKLAVQGWPPVTIILAALAVGLIVGTVNGLVVVKLRVNPIVATLAIQLPRIARMRWAGAPISSSPRKRMEPPPCQATG